MQLLTDFRARWDGRKPEDKLEPKLAFVLGWLTHRAADRQMKPVFREAEPDRTQSPSDCSVYHDAFVFKEVFAGGKESPYSTATFEGGMESLAAAAAFDVQDVEVFFRALLQRALIELHTFIPDRAVCRSDLQAGPREGATVYHGGKFLRYVAQRHNFEPRRIDPPRQQFRRLPVLHEDRVPARPPGRPQKYRRHRPPLNSSRRLDPHQVQERGQNIHRLRQPVHNPPARRIRRIPHHRHPDHLLVEKRAVPPLPVVVQHQPPVEAEDLRAFYAESYPENWFDPRMLETGQYYGIRESGRLVSVAGIHVYSPAYGVAALGNITTHPGFRGQGLGTAVTARVCLSLLESVEAIGLNVKSDNASAIRCYGKLGFEKIGEYEKFTATLKS